MLALPREKELAAWLVVNLCHGPHGPAALL